MSEWSKEAVLKTVDGLRRPGVRIPPLPPFSIESEFVVRLLVLLNLIYDFSLEMWVSG